MRMMLIRIEQACEAFPERPLVWTLDFSFRFSTRFVDEVREL
jgi:hypothetical protein